MFITGTWSQEPLKKVLTFMATAIHLFSTAFLIEATVHSNAAQHLPRRWRGLSYDDYLR